MFRRLESSLPKDFEFPADLDGLGYYVNEQDQIRNIERPHQQFHYFISKNERYVEMHKEAMDECIRRIVLTRLLDLGLQITRLPLGAPLNEPHVPILTSENLATCKRAIVYFGESCQDLGILAGRLIGSDSINHGSVVEFVKRIGDLNLAPEDVPGIIIANPGQLVWYRRGRKAMSWKSWYAIPRRTAIGSGLMMTEKNKIVGNEGPSEHVSCVFNEILQPMAKRGCKIDAIAVGDTGHDVVNHLQNEWNKWKDSMAALAVIESSYIWSTQFVNADFKDWFGKRARAYLLSGSNIGTPLIGRHKFGCNIYSSGENYYVECIMPHAHEAIIDYFKLVSRQPNFENVPQALEEPETDIDWPADEELHVEVEEEVPSPDLSALSKTDHTEEERIQELDGSENHVRERVDGLWGGVEESPDSDIVDLATDGVVGRSFEAPAPPKSGQRAEADAFGT